MFRSLIVALRSEEGAATAEYAIATMAPVSLGSEIETKK